MTHKICFIYFSFFTFFSLIGHMVISSDSFQKEDSALVMQLLDKGYYLLNADLDSAESYMLQAKEISERIDFKRGFLAFASHYNRVLDMRGLYSDALRLGHEALETAQSINDSSYIAVAYNNISHELTNMGNIELALKNQLEALKIAEELNDSIKIRKFNNNLASLFLDLRDMEKSYKYAIIAYEMALQLKDSVGIASSLVNLANSEILNKRYDKAIANFEAIIELARQIKDPSYELDALINLGHIENEIGEHDQALNRYIKGLEILEGYKVPDYIMYINWGLGESYFKLRQYNKADVYLKIGLETGSVLGALRELQYMYLLASQIKEKKSDLAAALDFRKKYEVIKDSISGEETKKNMHEMEIQYQVSQKEKEIAQQQLKIAQGDLRILKQQRWIAATISAIVGLLFLLGLIYVINHHKRKRAMEQLKLLEKEKEIHVLEAMIQGEEKERSRLAKELHDGIGGILSASKMHLSIFKNQLQDPELHKSLDLIDFASSEIRNIAHNLAPEFIENQGLDKALQAFCERVSNKNLQVLYYIFGEPPPLKLNFQIATYRIVQELVTNIIKHSGADQAIVQINFHEHAMTITVEDNGKGMQGTESKGIGLINLKSRVTAMSGIMEIDSRAGEGTSILLEFESGSHIAREPNESLV